MKNMKYVLLVLLVFVVSTFTVFASAVDDILGATKQHGGICLVIGDDSLELALELAEKSNFYVQIIQSDVAKAAKWNKQVAASKLRKDLSVRGTLFNEDQYGSDLINLIVVKDAKALGDTTSQELVRILAPRGYLFSKTKIKGIDTSLAEEKSVAGYASVLQKKVEPVVWKIADSMKWRAGARAHMSYGFMGVHGNGKYIYREYMEAEDSFPKTRTRIFARDGFNGRTIWTLEEPVGTSLGTWGFGQWDRSGKAMAIDDDNQFFYITHDKKLICLDAETGKQKFVLLDSKANSSYMKIYDNKYLVYNNTVFSTKTGEKIFRIHGKYVVADKKVYAISGKSLKVSKLVDGSVLLEKVLDIELPKKYGLIYLADKILITTGSRWVRPFGLLALDPSTGEKVWSHEFTGLFALTARGKKGEVFIGIPHYSEYNGKILAYSTVNAYVSHGDHQEVYITRIDPATGKVEEQDYGCDGTVFGSNCNNRVRRLGDYLYYWHNIWFNLTTKERVYPYIVHPGCFTPSMAANGYIYNVPGRKNGPIAGITAIGPADITFDQKVGGTVLQFTGKLPKAIATKATDWTRYRNDEMRSSFVTNSALGSTLTELWKTDIGLGSCAYDVMHERRTGLTQATVAYGLAFVTDIDSGCIVATDVKTGKVVWKYAVGSRVEFPPSLYQGLCLIAGQDGWVYCLDAKTGELVYKLLTAPRDRLVGGDEKLVSLWPARSDVFIKDGIGYISNGFAANVHGGSRAMAFDVLTGKTVWAKCWTKPDTVCGYPRPYDILGLFTSTSGSDLAMKGKKIKIATGEIGGKAVGLFLQSRYTSIDNLLAYGNSVGRTNEDRAHELFGDGRATGRSLAFDKGFSVAYTFAPKGESFVNTGLLHIKGFKGKEPSWSTEPTDFQVDDFVLTPKFIYAVGHYYRVKGEPELWVMSRDDGKVISKTTVGGFPSFGGMSASEDKLFIATREGKLICLKAVASK